MASFKVFINFKTYPQGTGENAVGLVKAIEKVSEGILRSAQNDKKNKQNDTAGEIASPPPGEIRNDMIEIIPIVQVVDLWRVKQETKLPVWVQHVDQFPQGKFTGWTNLEAVVEVGAVGTLLNHSEHPVPPGTIKQILGRIKNKEDRIKQFETMVCCKTLGQMERLVKLKPDYIGFEIAELIRTKTSITATNPKAIEHAVKICSEVPLVVGAGVNSAQDLVIAKRLGAKGVLVSSDIVLTKKPGQELRELLLEIS